MLQKMTPEKELQIAIAISKAIEIYEDLRRKEQTPTASEDLLFEVAKLLQDMFLD
jgi:hypothetical protein